MALVKDSQKGGHWFRLVDLNGTRGVLWEHELYDGIEFNKDAPFLYSFDGDVSILVNPYFISADVPSGMRDCICICRQW